LKGILFKETLFKVHRVKIVVKKFGGTSVADIGRIRSVARLLKDFREKNLDTKLVVVVSAMAGETNKLLALAKSCVAKPAARELDVLVATGEQVTVALLSMALIELGLPARSLLAQQARITTDRQFMNAKIESIDGSNVSAVLAQGEIAVVAGFQGVDEDGNVTTLGRGGSDITAVALAAALYAEACYIYTDVEGVFTADPRLCPKARLVNFVSHEEMLELANLGAKVLHARSVYFAMMYRVPMVVLSTFNPEGGATWVVEEEKLVEKPIVTGITYRTDDAKLTIHRMRNASKALGAIFSRLADEDVFIDMITQTGLEGGYTSVSFTVPDEKSSRALALLQEAVPALGAEGVSIERDIAKVSAVGVGMQYHTGVAAKLFEALAAEGIEVKMISTSEIKISVVVPRKYCEVAVRALHRTFIEMTPAIVAEPERSRTLQLQA
jgi:aspartate kinase